MAKDTARINPRAWLNVWHYNHKQGVVMVKVKSCRALITEYIESESRKQAAKKATKAPKEAELQATISSLREQLRLLKQSKELLEANVNKTYGTNAKKRKASD